MKKISTTSTKNDIMEAYEEIVGILNDQKQENTLLKKDLAEKAKTVSNAKDFVANADFSVSLDQFSVAFVKQITQIKSRFQDEKQVFLTIQQAVSIEKSNLEELYKINAQAESLEALVLAHNQAKEKFEIDFELLKLKSNVEIETAKTTWAETIAKTKADKVREEEEFIYKQKIVRRNDEDAYVQSKSKLESELNSKKEQSEKEFAERDAELKLREDELIILRKQQTVHEQNLTSAIVKTENEVSERLKTEYDFKQKIDNKELEVQIKLFQQEIDLLKLKSGEQQQIIADLNEKSTKASDQVKDIALKAIEGVSQSRWNSDKRDDNARKPE